MTSPQIVLCKSDLRHHHDRRSRVKKCRSDLKHFLNPTTILGVDNIELRDLCDIWHDTSSAHSRNCMRQW